MPTTDGSDQSSCVEPALLMDLWSDERCCAPKSQRTDWLAYYQWLNRGCPPQTEEECKKEWEEAAWRLEKLLPSFMFDAALHRDALAERLAALSVLEVDGQDSVCLIVALDGGPEFAHDCYQRSADLGRLPEDVVRHKDARFYRFASVALEAYGATVVDRVPDDTARSAGVPRLFQDACLAVVAGRESLGRAVATACYVRQRHEEYNEEQQHAWPLRLHPRLSVGSTWESAIDCLHLVRRGEIGVAQESWNQLSRAERNLLLAIGVRLGPTSTRWAEEGAAAIRSRSAEPVRAGLATSAAAVG
jgi:hypothetical protein